MPPQTTKKTYPADIGSRSTSERSSNLSGREGFDLKQFSEKMLEETSVPVIRNRSGRAVKNPLHADYIQFARPGKGLTNKDFKGP